MARPPARRLSYLSWFAALLASAYCILSSAEPSVPVRSPLDTSMDSSAKKASPSLLEGSSPLDGAQETSSSDSTPFLERAASTRDATGRQFLEKFAAAVTDVVGRYASQILPYPEASPSRDTEGPLTLENSVSSPSRKPSAPESAALLPNDETASLPMADDERSEEGSSPAAFLETFFTPENLKTIASRVDSFFKQILQNVD